MIDWIDELWFKVRSLFRRGGAQNDLDDELAFHLELLEREHMRNGFSKEAARKAALREFGEVESLKDACRDSWGMRLWNDFLRDLRLASRQARNNRGFTFVVLLTLGLCIGANTAIFSMLNNALLKPYPYPHSEQLVDLVTDMNEKGHIRTISDSSPESYTWYREAASVAEMGYYRNISNTVILDGIASNVTSVDISPSFFRVLQVQPIHGRWFYEEEGTRGKNRVTILSYDFWQSAFNGDAGVLGQLLEVDGGRFEIVGVMPEGFYFNGREVSFWLPSPIAEDSKTRNPWRSSYLNIVARLKSGVSIQSAQLELDAVLSRMVETFPESRSYVESNNWRPRFVDYHSGQISNSKGPLLMLQGGALLVLIIGCVNVANLSLTRAISRTRELLLRSMLGAGLGRIARMLMTESFFYASLGGICGILFGWGAMELIKVVGLYRYPRAESFGLDLSVLIFTLAVSVLVALIVGMIPLYTVLRDNLLAGTRQSDRTVSSGIASQRARAWLVVTQVSMTFILLICSGLLVKSFTKLLTVDPGFNPERVIFARIDSPRQLDDLQRKQFFSNLVKRVEELPGVVAAGTNVTSPFSNNWWSRSFDVEDYEYGPGEPNHNFAVSQVDGSYFDALGLEALEGRTMVSTDFTPTSQLVAVVDKNFADYILPGKELIGRRITYGINREAPGDTRWFTIVGVVNVVKHFSLEETDAIPKPRVYVPARDNNSRSQQLIVRFQPSSDEGIATSDGVMMARLRAAVSEFETRSPIYDIEMLETRIDSTLGQRKASMRLVMGFTVLAVFLSSVGLYGVISNSFRQRRKDLGIRLAIGAPKSSLLNMMLQIGIRMTGTGILVGFLGSVGIAYVIRSQFFQVQAVDPVVYLLVSVLMASVSFIAVYIPSRQALKLDPMETLRVE